MKWLALLRKSSEQQQQQQIFFIYVTHDYKLKIVSTQIAQANQGGLKKQELIIVMIVIVKDYKANEIENKGDYYDNTKGGFICNLRV